MSCSVFVSLDVEVAVNWWRKEHRSYFVWEFGKPPELVLEIVSNQEGGEDAEKKRKYIQMRISYHDTWLRWTDAHSVLIPTGKERAEQAEQQLLQERQRAEQERQRAEHLAALLRQAGIDPDQR